MEWPIILVMAIAAPLILLPVAFVWYLNIAGVAKAYKGREEEHVEVKKTGAATGRPRAKAGV